MERAVPACERGSGEFCLATARLMAGLSDYAYGRSPIPGGHDPTWVTAGDTQCVIVEFDTFVAVAFRGTEKNFGDILTDIQIRKVDFQDRHEGGSLGGRVHGGFFDAFRDVESHVAERLKALGKSAYLTGHSLGGALAIIGEGMPWVAAVYTFGAPRVGDEQFACYSDTGAPHHRIVNRADIVPWLPLLALGYRHSGTLRYIDRAGGLLEEPDLPLLLRNVAGRLACACLSGNWSRGVPLAGFADHRIGEYIKNLEAIA